MFSRKPSGQLTAALRCRHHRLNQRGAQPRLLQLANPSNGGATGAAHHVFELRWMELLLNSAALSSLLALMSMINGFMILI